MKKLFVLTVLFALVLTTCDQPTGNSSKITLTIRNQSSYDLSDVKFSGLTFAIPGSSDELPKLTEASIQVAVDFIKTGYVNFVVHKTDFDIECRTIPEFDDRNTFTIIDSTVVEEIRNTSNKKSLREITFLSTAVVEHEGRGVAKNDTINLGEAVVNITKQNEFTIKNTGVGRLILSGNNPVKIEGDTDVFTAVQPSSSEIAPNDSLTFKINFKPINNQPYTATVTISSNDQNGNFTFTITATGVPPKPIAIVLYENNEISDMETIEAGEVIITQSKNIDVVIKNTGTEILTIDTENITITGTDVDAYNILVPPNTSIPTGGGQSLLTIEYKPVKSGVNNAILTIPTTDTSRSLIIVYLRGTSSIGSAVPELSQGSTNISHNSITPFDFGRVELGTSTTRTFTITNTGNIALELIGNIESSTSVFTITAQPSINTIAPTADTSFIIRYLPTAEAENTGTITITYNGNAQFALNIKGTGYMKRPQISVFYEETKITQNGTFDAGEVLVTLSKDINFGIRNTGEATLEIHTENITITGTDAAAFTGTASPAVSMNPGGYTLFTIRCTPSRVGEHNAILTIPSNDNLRNPFVINLKMAGVRGNAIPELSQGSTIITNNSITPFDFGRVEVGANTTQTFSIKNNGNIALELIGNIESSNPVFTVTAQPSTNTIAPAADTSFIIRYLPTAEVENTGAITITYNDNAKFILNVKGTGYAQKSQITVSQGTSSISPFGEYDFGVILIGKNGDATFTIGNSGEVNLTFTVINGNRINLEDNDNNHFLVTMQPTATVAPGASTTFTIRFNPKSVGTNLTAAVQIKTNSLDNSDFSFRIKGTGRSYVIGDEGPGGGIIFYAQGGQFKECSGDLGYSNWNNAITMALNYRGGGFSDWYLPDQNELLYVAENIHDKGMGDFYDETYWSSFDNNGNATLAVTVDFWIDGEGLTTKNKSTFHSVIAVRTFTL